MEPWLLRRVALPSLGALFSTDLLLPHLSCIMPDEEKVVCPIFPWNTAKYPVILEIFLPLCDECGITSLWKS